MLTTLNMTFSVNDYLELHNATSIYCISHILQTNVELVFGHYRTSTFLWVKNDISNKEV
jgi:hypothetical protein